MTANRASASLVLTLENADFQASGHDSTPTGWTAGGPNGGQFIYASGGGIPAGTRVLSLKRSDNWVQQSFDTNEVTAESFGTFVVTFDSGWRNNTSSISNDITLLFEIRNVTDGGVLASNTYDFPPNTPSNLLDNYRVIQTGNTIVLNYDNSLASLAGDEIALRMTTLNAVNSFNPTGWIDNISVTAVPEPGSLAVLGIACGGFWFSQRRTRRKASIVNDHPPRT